MVLVDRQRMRMVQMYREGHSSIAIAEHFGCNKGVVLRALQNAGVKRRQGNGRLRRILFTESQVQRIIKRWKKGYSVWGIAIEMNVANTAVKRVLQENGVKVVPRLQRFAQCKPFIVNLQGYRLVLLRSDSPYFQMCPRLLSKTSGYVLEHRLAMAQHLGRPLHRWETVHHVDGNRTNNDISNLQLVNGNHGTGYSARCKHCGSVELEYIPLGKTNA